MDKNSSFRTITIYMPDYAEREIYFYSIADKSEFAPTGRNITFPQYSTTLDWEGRGEVELPAPLTGEIQYRCEAPNGVVRTGYLAYASKPLSLFDWMVIGVSDYLRVPNDLSDVHSVPAVWMNLLLIPGTHIMNHYTALEDLGTQTNLYGAADKLPYMDGALSFALTDITAFMRSLLDDADASTARTTLGAAAAADIPDELTDLDTAVTGAELDADHSKLAGIESNATADQTAGEIEAIVSHDNLLDFAANEHVALPNTIANVLSDAGTMAAQDASSVLITGGSMGNVTLVNVGIVSLSSDLAIAHGGTGASDAATARTNLGAAAAADIPDELTDLDTAVTGAELDDIAANVADIVRESDGKLQINGGTTYSLIRLVNSSSGSGSSDGAEVDLYGSTMYVSNYEGAISINPSDDDGARFDNNSTAGNTRMLLYDVDTGSLVRVSVGADDSGGSGYKVLRIPN